VKRLRTPSARISHLRFKGLPFTSHALYPRHKSVPAGTDLPDERH
jgi:hypothetical protein